MKPNDSAKMPAAWKAAGLTCVNRQPPSRRHLSPPSLPSKYVAQVRAACKADGRGAPNSYNRYLAVAARTVRRCLKEDKRIAAERRGEMELRFAKWQVGARVAGPLTREAGG